MAGYTADSEITEDFSPPPTWKSWKTSDKLLIENRAALLGFRLTRYFLLFGSNDLLIVN